MKSIAFAAGLILSTNAGIAQETPLPILFTNVNVFDGVTDGLIENANVLVVDNLIAEVSPEPLAAANARIIDGGGRTLMPGMLDMHVHISTFGPVQTQSRDGLHPYAHGALAADRAEGMLMNGFTTVRDLGGPSNFMRLIIDEGLMVEPRIYPTENWITTTSVMVISVN